MVQIMIGHKGSGKTKKMIELANNSVETAKGNIVFITKNERLNFDLKYFVRIISMEDYSGITNRDEYIGFIYGIISGDHDLETMYIDGVLKHADITVADLPRFLDRLKAISKLYDVNFVVSISADKEEMEDVDFDGLEIIK